MTTSARICEGYPVPAFAFFVVKQCDCRPDQNRRMCRNHVNSDAAFGNLHLSILLSDDCRSGVASPLICQTHGLIETPTDSTEHTAIDYSLRIPPVV